MINSEHNSLFLFRKSFHYMNDFNDIILLTFCWIWDSNDELCVFSFTFRFISDFKKRNINIKCFGYFRNCRPFESSFYISNRCRVKSCSECKLFLTESLFSTKLSYSLPKDNCLFFHKLHHIKGICCINIIYYC